MEKKIGQTEFVILMALIMSYIALAVDAMLPALVQIGSDLSVTDPTYIQYVISSIFAGMGIGLIFFGPLSDSIGRKPVVILGGLIYIVGCVLSYQAQSFEVMLFGRALQGLGGASARVITVAMIRDRFVGAKMAKVMSLIMIIFILVPAFAPSLGLIIIKLASWREIFLVMAGVSLFATIWFYFRQEETLLKEKRKAFRLGIIWNGVKETVTHSQSWPYMLSAGFIFGSFVGYLSLSQQILEIDFHLGSQFAFAFGGLALFIGSASFFNSFFVETLGMRKMVEMALIGMFSLSICGFALELLGVLSFWPFYIYAALNFICLGILFGNLNALALQALGHIAGVANSVISSVQTFMSALIGSLIGAMYDGTPRSLLLGYVICSSLAMFFIKQFAKKHVVEGAVGKVEA